MWLKVVHRFVSVIAGESEVGEEAGRVIDYCSVSGSRNQGLKNVGSGFLENFVYQSCVCF